MWYSNNNENKFLSLAYWCKNDIADLNKFDANGVSILSFKKHPCTCKARIFQMLRYLVSTYSINIIARDFNYDLLKVLQNKFLDIFADHVQMVNNPTHISGSLTDHVYLKKALMEECFTNVSVENIFQIMML